jgi:hypothetical protein
MEVDYLLYHEDSSKIEKMLENLTAEDDGLFDPRCRYNNHLATTGNAKRWKHVRVRHLQRVGPHVIQYNVTLPPKRSYPELVAALLIEAGWEVKVRYRNVDATRQWTIIQCQFPEGTEYTLPEWARPPPAPADGAAPTTRPRTSLTANLAALKACSTQL